MIINKKETEVWYGEHLGVRFEINHWVSPPNVIEPNERQHWTYYLIIELDKIPEENNPESYWIKPIKDERFSMTTYAYYKHDVIPNLDWHGGISWYSKEAGIDDTPRVIKIGCDYSHLWDEGMIYDLDLVKAEVRCSIEEFIRRVPKYKYRCMGNGKLYQLHEGLITEGGRFASAQYYAGKDWFKKLWNEVYGKEKK